MAQTITEIIYELHLATDLHIGSGVGLPGVIDEYVVRDHQGFSYAPFSEIKGVVRDSCVRLMKYLDCYNRYVCDGQRAQIDARRQGTASPKGFCELTANKPCVLCAVFGSPITPARWWFSPAEYKDEYRDTIGRFEAKAGNYKGAGHSFARRDSATSAHAAIDPQTRRAAEKQLFNLEIVRLPDMGDILEKFSIWKGQILYQEPLPDAKEAECGDDELIGWLLAALLSTRRIGGRRRRGWGRCRFVLCGDSKQALEGKLDDWLNRLQANGVLTAGG